MSASHRTLRGVRLCVVLVAVAATVVLSAAPGAAEEPERTPPPFRFSGIAAEGRAASGTATPGKGAAVYPAVPTSGAGLTVGGNVNVIGGGDVVQLGTMGGASVNTCNPGKQTAQNETTVAVDRANADLLIGGANDYRLYEPSENRYDGSGGVYRSLDGGRTWSLGFLPGLVRANTAAPGPYESAGDPSVAAGPANTFWYANIAFNRTDDANSIAASRSVDGGATWTTNYVLQTSAADGFRLLNDKEWIGPDPTTGNVAYVTWTQFHSTKSGNFISAPIVISNTTDGGATWSPPKEISKYNVSQGSVVAVDSAGRVHVVYETFAQGLDRVAYSVSSDGGATFKTRLIGTINDIPNPLPGSTFRTNSFPGFALDGSSLHVVWSNWNGTDADVVYVRSTDGGTTWSSPLTVAGGPGDSFYPWVAANGAKAYVSWLQRQSANAYDTAARGSSDTGATWSPAQTITTATSDADEGNFFSFPDCAANFIGDYTGIAVGSDGVGHPLWTDIRVGNDTATTADQDAYTATLALP